MAFGANTIWEVQTGGSDTACAGGFNPANGNFTANNLSVTSGTTTAPVVTNAEYNYVANDVGAWIFIQSGTNWIPGWYKISSVASNLATIDATIGHAVLYGGVLGSTTSAQPTANTAQGCVTGSYVSGTASGKGGIDYSQGSNGGAVAAITYADLLIGSTTTQFTSILNPVAKNLIGNIINNTAGTNVTVQMVEVVSTSGTTATCDKSLGTAAATGTASYMGGPFASPGQAAKQKILCPAGSDVFIKSGTYTLTNTTVNTAVGPVSDTVGGVSASNPSRWEGYGTYRADKGTKPVISAGLQATFTIMAASGTAVEFDNITVDGNGGAATRGFDVNASRSMVMRCMGQNCKSSAFDSSTGTGEIQFWYCKATTNTNGAGGAFALSAGSGLFAFCESYANTTNTHGFAVTGVLSVFICCTASANTGTADGFLCSGRNATLFGCVAYNNGRHGFNLNGSGTHLCINCIAEGQVAGTAYGFTAQAVGIANQLINCAGYNNTTANVNTTNIPTPTTGFVAGSSTFFTNAGSSDFSLNNTAGGGAAARAAGLATMPNSTQTGYPDIGAVQHQDAGAAGMLYNPGLVGSFVG